MEVGWLGVEFASDEELARRLFSYERAVSPQAGKRASERPSEGNWQETLK